MVGIIDQLHEAVLRIKGSCLLVDGIDLDGTHADMICKMLRSAQRIHEQQFSQALSLHGLIDGQSPQQNYRNIDVR